MEYRQSRFMRFRQVDFGQQFPDLLPLGYLLNVFPPIKALEPVYKQLILTNDGR
jgi:hypothetical protein